MLGPKSSSNKLTSSKVFTKPTCSQPSAEVGLRIMPDMGEVPEPAPVRHSTIGSKAEYDSEAQDFRSPGIKKSKTWWSRWSATTTVVEQSPPQSPRSARSSRASLERTNTYRVEDEALHGYPKLANLIGNTDNYGIYRSFAALSARNLLYHQARVTHLEHKLNELEKKYEEHTDLRYRARDILFEPQKPGTPGHELQLVHEEISKALDTYHHLLLVRAKVHKLPKPDDNFVGSIWDITHSTKLEDPNWLQHPEDTAYAIWEDRKPIQTDLVTLNPVFRQQDPFTKFFTGRLLDWWHNVYAKISKPDGDLDEYVYGDHAISRYMRACVMIVAAALPTCSIVALYFIDNPAWRLGFIVMFSGVFASALSFFTEARSIDIFTASVALASVQVVFVGTTFGNGNGPGNGGNG